MRTSPERLRVRSRSCAVGRSRTCYRYRRAPPKRAADADEAATAPAVAPTVLGYSMPSRWTVPQHLAVASAAVSAIRSHCHLAVTRFHTLTRPSRDFERAAGSRYSAKATGVPWSSCDASAALCASAQQMCWPTSTARTPLNDPTETINGRLGHPRGSVLGFRNLSNYIVRSELETGGFRSPLHRQIQRAS